MKSTKKSLLISILSICLCVAMLLGTTYAWFTDSVQSGINTIQAGNLDVELYHANPKLIEEKGEMEKVTADTKLFTNVELWEPGAFAMEVLSVANEGNLALKYNLNFNFDNETKVDGHGLSEVLKVGVLTMEEQTPLETREQFVSYLNEYDKWQPLASFSESGNLVAEDENSWSTKMYVIYWEPGENDNLYNMNNGNKDETLTIDLGVNLVATQDTVEADSFDNQYDAGTVIPTLVSEKVEEDKDTVLKDNKNGIKVTVPAGGSGDATTLNLFIEPTDKPANIVVTSNQGYKSVEVTLKDQNGKKVSSSGDLLYIAEINVGKGCSGLKLYHNASEMVRDGAVVADHYSYDDATGIATAYISSFSPFTVVFDAVAQIGDAKFSSLQAAVDTVKSGETIELLCSVTSGFSGIEQILGKDFTVDMGTPMIQDDYGNWTDGGSIYVVDAATGLKYYGGGKQMAIDGNFKGTDLYIPEGVEELVRMKTAYNAPNLTRIYFPTTIKEIHGREFINCKKLEKIYSKVGDQYVEGLPQTLTFIGESAFQSCTALSMAIEIPDGINKVCVGAFYEAAITSVVFHSDITGIGEGAFRACTNLTEVTLPSSIVSLGNYVFRDCANLKTMRFEFESVPDSFESFSFASVSALFNNTADRTVLVKNQAVADAMWSKLDPAARAHYTIKNIDNESIIYYPVG